jgi:hypothetical protein
MQAKTRLPLALAEFGLLPSPSRTLLRGMDVVPKPKSAPRCGAGRPAAKKPQVRTVKPQRGRD